jgi:iron complex transport system permease protein
VSRPAPDRHVERRRAIVATVVLAVLLIVSLAAATTIGSSGLAIGDVARAVLAHLGIGANPLGPLDDGIVWQLRLPRVLTAACVGAGLALVGAIMQGITSNQLADPYLLGLSSGASLGAVSVLLLGIPLLLPAAAFLGALVALGLTLALAGALGPITPTRTVLAGVAVSALGTALTSFVIFWTARGDAYQDVLNWLLGSVAGARWPQLGIAAFGIVVLGIPLMLGGRVLDAFAFGDRTAASLGVPVTGTRWALLGASAVLTGILVSVSGSIGFIGLVLPHAVRLLAGPRHRVLLPLAALVGAIALVWADTAARTVLSPRELPVGIVTALVGAPVFAVILGRRRSAA